MPRTIGVIGMGYVGLTLTAALANKGYVVYGVDVQPTVIDALRHGRPHIFEPGVAQAFAEHAGKTVFIDDALPRDLVDVAVICVSTPVDQHTLKPNLTNLATAARQIAEWCGPETLVVVRSTVPVGTSRRVVLPALQQAARSTRAASTPASSRCRPARPHR